MRHGKPHWHRRHAWWPLLVLLLGLSAVFVFGGDREHFYRPWVHDWISVQDLALAESLFAKPFRFVRVRRGEDGRLMYNAYNRRPIGVFVLIKLAVSPFANDMSARIYAARMLMLGLFAAAAVLAYLSLARVTGDRWVASGATLLAFSSCYTLGYADAIASEGSTVLFALLLVFHGMVRFADAGDAPQPRFAQLLLKVCAALLLAWQVYGLLLAFLALGVAAAAIGAWRQDSPGREAVRDHESVALSKREAALARATFGGQYALLAVVALLFGGAVLGYNLLAEHAAYYGEKSFAELPSARSALHRTGLGGGAAEPLLSADFYRWQFHWVGVMALPYALPGLPPIWVNHPLDPTWAQPRLASVGVAVVAICLLGLFLCRQRLCRQRLCRQRRMLLAVLAFAGVCWSLPMRFETATLDHDFEALAYIGLPLAFFALLLLGVRRSRRWGPRLVVGLAVGAAVTFALSAKRMAELGWDAETKERQQTLFAEFEAIRAHARGSDVLIAAAPEATLYLALIRRKFWYYLSGSVLQYPGSLPAEGHEADFVLSLERVESDLLLTPSHRFVFLYRSLGALEEIAAARRRQYERIAARAPEAQASWDIHMLGGGAGGGELAFLKTPCAERDAAGRFLVHVTPVDAQDLPASRRHLRFDNLDFGFLERGGVLFDGKCMVKVPLPEHPLAVLRVGGFDAGGAIAWERRLATGLRTEALRRAARRAQARQPAARGDFNVYVDGKMLTYIREPCTAAQAAAPFFLHVMPVKSRDLPRVRRRAGFDNLDFRMEDSGGSFDGKCVARVRLPDYPIASVYTGQQTPAAGVSWSVEFPLRVREP